MPFTCHYCLDLICYPPRISCVIPTPGFLVHLADPLCVANVTLSDIDELLGKTDGCDIDWRQLEGGRPQNRIEIIAGQHTLEVLAKTRHPVCI